MGREREALVKGKMYSIIAADKIKAKFSLYSLKGMFLLFFNWKQRSKQAVEIKPVRGALSHL